MNPHLSKATTTPDTALTTKHAGCKHAGCKHAGWVAARAGKEAWIIDSGSTDLKWFEYTCYGNIKQMRRVRKGYCEKLREGKTL